MEALFYRTEILSQHNFRPKEFVLTYEARVEDPNVSTARVSTRRYYIMASLRPSNDTACWTLKEGSAAYLPPTQVSTSERTSCGEEDRLFAS